MMMANAIITQNYDLFQQAVHKFAAINQESISIDYSFLNQIYKEADLQAISSLSSTMRSLFSKALRLSLDYLDEGAVAAILDYSKAKRLSLTVNQLDMAHLIRAEAFNFTYLLVKAAVNLEKDKKIT